MERSLCIGCKNHFVVEIWVLTSRKELNFRYVIHKQKEMPQHLFFLAFTCSFNSALKYIQCDECEGTYQPLEFSET